MSVSIVSQPPEKGSFEDFIVFCKEQPADREIDHSFTFDECAVGDYLRDRGIYYNSASSWAKNHLPETFFERLNNSGCSSVSDETYGELVEHLVANY